MLAAGCMSIKTTHDVKKEEIHVQMEASEDQLLANYNEQARAVRNPASDCGPDPQHGVYLQWRHRGIPRGFRVHPGKTSRDGARVDRAGAGGRDKYLRHGERRRNVPDFYSIEKYVPVARLRSPARIEKAD